MKARKNVRPICSGNFVRFFGDSDGDRDVDGRDQVKIRLASLSAKMRHLAAVTGTAQGRLVDRRLALLQTGEPRASRLRASSVRSP
jgi:hypothetical protein